MLIRRRSSTRDKHMVTKEAPEGLSFFLPSLSLPASVALMLLADPSSQGIESFE
jgi:hypothetical protein